MKVEVHFKINRDDYSSVDDALSKAQKSFSGFFGNNRDYGGYSFIKIENNIWALSGDGILIFKVLSILAEKYNGLSNVLAVDSYVDGLKYLVARNDKKYKFRFRTPYYINYVDKESHATLIENEGPYTLNEAQELISMNDSDNIFDEELKLVKGVPGIDNE